QRHQTRRLAELAIAYRIQPAVPGEISRKRDDRIHVSTRGVRVSATRGSWWCRLRRNLQHYQRHNECVESFLSAARRCSPGSDPKLPSLRMKAQCDRWKSILPRIDRAG